MKRKLCIFPNDSLKTYFNKGEIKQKYFNPKDYFDEIHIISLFDDEINKNKVKELAGNGILEIHNIGKVNLFNYRRFEKKINKLVEQISPSIIRSYNPLLQGWLATKASKKLKIPLVVSLHTNYEQQRKTIKDERKFFRYFKSKYLLLGIEKFVIRNADAIICVYEFIVPYARKMGARNIHVIYNKVDSEKFSPNCEKQMFFDKPTILSVGRLIDQKNHRLLIEAIKNLDVNLVIIGNGPNYRNLINLIKLLNIEKKVNIIKKILNKKLGGYYVSCDIYAQPMVNLGGIPIPVLEAMSCGLPVVMSKHETDYSEIVDDAIVFVDNNSKSFETAFTKILFDSEYKDSLKRKSLNVINDIRENKMEEKELNLYKALMKY